MHDPDLRAARPWRRSARACLLGTAATFVLAGCAATPGDAAAPHVAGAAHVTAPTPVASPGQRRANVARRALALR
jgi:hypothetical protein